MNEALREKFAKELRALGAKDAATFAEAIVDAASPEGPRCWGQLVDRFDEIFTRDEDRLAILPALFAFGDIGTWLLFVDVNRDRPGVLAAIAKEAPRLPFTVQCALAAMPDGKAHLGGVRALHPAAAAIVAGDDVLRAREHAVYTAHANALRSHRARIAPSTATSTEVPEAKPPGDLP